MIGVLESLKNSEDVAHDQMSGFRRHETYLKLFEESGFKRYENMYKTGKGAVKIRNL